MKRSLQQRYAKFVLKIGGAGGDRTRDLLDAIEARSQLRYGPTVNPSPSLSFKQTSRWIKDALLAQERSIT